MRLRTIGLISTLVLGLLAGPLPTEAQQAGKVYRIGYLGGGSPYDLFRQPLAAYILVGLAAVHHFFSALRESPPLFEGAVKISLYLIRSLIPNPKEVLI